MVQDDRGITLNQSQYTKKILENAGMAKCNSPQAPMELGLNISKVEEEQEINATDFRRNIGCFRYLLNTRPDLSFCVGVLSRYMHSLRESHGVALKQCLRYLQGSISYGLFFERSLQKVPRLIGYSDSSYNVDPDDGRSTTGHIFYLGKSPITWCSQKQDTLALSSCEAEFMAGTEAARQAIWLRDLLSEVTGQAREKVTIRIDNQSAIALKRNPVFHGRSKHIHSGYHFIRECVERELIEVEHVPGNEQEKRDFIGMQELPQEGFMFRRENVG